MAAFFQSPVYLAIVAMAIGGYIFYRNTKSKIAG
jgi:hypothetical protein